MRKGFRGLETVIVQTLAEDPLSGDLFVFLNRRGRLLKCFVWDRTGYVIISKRLEQGRVHFRARSDKIELDTQRLKLIFDGISVGGFSE
jgi:transposase